MLVVELDERVVLAAEVVEAVEHLGAEERLVPDVVEVFDDAVAPRFAQWDEPGGDTEIETRRDDGPEVLELGWDPASEVGVVVELRDLGDPDTAPDADEGRGQQWWLDDLQDVVTDGVRTDVDEVQHVELDTAEEVPWSDQVDLVGGADLYAWRSRVGHALGHVAGLAATRPAQAFPGDDPLDRARRRDRLDTEAAQLPLDRQRAVLRSRVRNSRSRAASTCWRSTSSVRFGETCGTRDRPSAHPSSWPSSP